jgi:hypothetical protein
MTADKFRSRALGKILELIQTRAAWVNIASSYPGGNHAEAVKHGGAYNALIEAYAVVRDLDSHEGDDQ